MGLEIHVLAWERRKNGAGAIMAVIIWYLGLQLPMQSVTITTDVVSSNLDHGEMYSIM